MRGVALLAVLAVAACQGPPPRLTYAAMPLPDGELVLIPGKEGTQEKRIPLDVFFKKIVMVRDKLRVLEQKVNGNKNLSDEEKVQLQQYITGCYGSLTSFNILFKRKEDQFSGQKK